MTITERLEKIDEKTNQKINEYNEWIKKTAYPFYKNLIIQTLVYILASFTYIAIYNRYGFEKTMVVLLVGVVVYTIRK